MYWYHNDHLGTPQVMTNAIQQVVLKADYEAFGGTAIQINIVDNPLRFPGQYADSQIPNFNYNWNRFYNASQRRYISSDPIGLSGGYNTFAYVGNDPADSIDPFGLYECTYSISAHQLTCTPSVLVHPAFQSSNFVTGNNRLSGPTQFDLQNNPSATGVKFHGPLPQGDYTIGRQRPGSSRRDLTPDPRNDMQDRDSMQLHGCRDPSTCSDGCIAAKKNTTRDEINRDLHQEEGRNRLHVVP